MEQKKQEATVADNCKGIDLSRREMLIGAGAWMAGAAVSQLGLVTPAWRPGPTARAACWAGG